jgi:hypothetical protein
MASRVDGRRIIWRGRRADPSLFLDALARHRHALSNRQHTDQAKASRSSRATPDGSARRSDRIAGRGRRRRNRLKGAELRATTSAGRRVHVCGGYGRQYNAGAPDRSSSVGARPRIIESGARRRHAQPAVSHVRISVPCLSSTARTNGPRRRRRLAQTRFLSCRRRTILRFDRPCGIAPPI